MTTLRLDTREGRTMAATAAGDPSAQPVLLFHGGGQTRHAWGKAVRAIAERGWYAVSFDLPGHGDSDWLANRDEYNIDVFANDLAAVASQFTDPALVGASLGGMAALVATGGGLCPASALVLVDITPQPSQAGVDRIRAFMRTGADGFDSLEDVADAIASYLPDRKRPSDLSGLTKNVRQRADGKWMWHWDPAFMGRIEEREGEPTSGRFHPEGLLENAARSLTAPTLLVRGGNSDVVSEENAKQLRLLIPHAEIVNVAGAGHMVAGDRNDRFNAAVVDFLARVIPPS